MIRNLNQVSFQEYGRTLPERTAKGRAREKGIQQELTLPQHDAVLFRARSEVRLQSLTGLAVLSVSLDGEKYHHFYLDKPVRSAPA